MTSGALLGAGVAGVLVGVAGRFMFSALRSLPAWLCGTVGGAGSLLGTAGAWVAGAKLDSLPAGIAAGTVFAAVAIAVMGATAAIGDRI